MKLQKEVESSICGFYANKWHLATMLLPFISKKIEEKTKIVTILEEEIEENIKELLKKINLSSSKKEEILNIGWTSKNKIDLKQIDKKDKEITIIITGTKEDIDKKNKEIINLIGKKINKINIINLYEIDKIDNVNEILEKHKFIINTSGIHKIEEIYPNMKKKETKIS